MKDFGAFLRGRAPRLLLCIGYRKKMHKGGTLRSNCFRGFRLLLVTGLATCAVLWGADAALPSTRIPAEHKQQYTDLAVTLMQQYLRIDTTNPPGNEMKAAEFFKKIFDQEGIENRVFEIAPGRADLWARIPHTGGQGKRPIILLNHMDVVTRDRKSVV